MGASGGHQLSFLKFFEICQDRKAMTHRDHGCVNFAWASVYIAARWMCGRGRPAVCTATTKSVLPALTLTILLVLHSVCVCVCSSSSMYIVVVDAKKVSRESRMV